MKNLLINNLMDTVDKFETATGVYIKSVDFNFEKIDTRTTEGIPNKSALTSIKLNFK